MGDSLKVPYVHPLVNLMVAVTPLFLSILFGWLVTGGRLNLGGGEKDIFLAAPLLLWALVFLLCYIVLWWRGIPFRRLIAISSAVATVLMVVVTVFMLFGVPWL